MQGDHWIIKNDQDKNFLVEHIKQMKITKDIVVFIVDAKEKRTQLQNKYLWGWIYQNIVMQLELGGIVINTETGEVPYTKEILHEIFKRKYLVKQVIETKKKSIEIYSSTTDLSTKEFVEFCENVKKFCFQFWNISIPPTNGNFQCLWQQWEKEARSQ